MSKKTTSVSLICNRLSQYIGDKRRHNAAIRITPPTPRDPGGSAAGVVSKPTMNLLPGVEESSCREDKEKEEPPTPINFDINKTAADRPRMDFDINKVAADHPHMDFDINKVAADHPPMDFDVNETDDHTRINIDINQTEAAHKSAAGEMPKILTSITETQKLVAEGKGEVEKGHQLTMFYRGKVLVFDDVSVTKADDMISSMMATKTATATTVSGEESHPNKMKDKSQSMPIARRGSLHKFLEKRKERRDRISSNAPYPDRTTMSGSVAKPEASSSNSGSDPLWLLGLGHKDKGPKN